MAEQHPITPPQELVRQWAAEYWSKTAVAALGTTVGCQCYIATQTAKWCHEQRGAELQKARDEELEACCAEMREHWGDIHNAYGWELSQDLRDARRPKPPSLKEQMLARTKAILNDPNRVLPAEVRETLELNQRALEAIPDE